MPLVGDIQNTEQDMSLRENDRQASLQLGRIYSNGSLAVQAKNLTGNLVASTRDNVFIANCTGAPIQITIPLSTSWGTNRTPILTFCRADGSANNLTITCSGGDLIFGVGASVVVPGNGTIQLVTGTAGVWYPC